MIEGQGHLPGTLRRRDRWLLVLGANASGTIPLIPNASPLHAPPRVERGMEGRRESGWKQVYFQLTSTGFDGPSGFNVASRRARVYDVAIRHSFACAFRQGRSNDICVSA